MADFCLSALAEIARSGQSALTTYLGRFNGGQASSSTSIGWINSGPWLRTFPTALLTRYHSNSSAGLGAAASVLPGGW